MASTKQEYKLWKKESPQRAPLHKLHAQDIHDQFGGLPRPVTMSWEDYDRYIHLNDLCAYDLLLMMLGPGVMLGQPPFSLDQDAACLLAIGRHAGVRAEGKVQADGSYLVSLRPMTAAEKKSNIAGRVAVER